ncbi:MAG TPA: hypothetical protein VJN88_08950 [Ktedonobacterales bacterium]|nr:hypothetical protein [Ktedonobacterales bacterium]
MRRLARRLNLDTFGCRLVYVLAVICALASLSFASLAGSATGHTSATNSSTTWAQDSAWFQQMIALYASGNAPIQSAAASTLARAGLPSADATSVSADVRATWVRLMSADPASLGRVGVAPNRAGQQAALGALRANLQGIAGARYNAFLTQSAATYASVSAPGWLTNHGLLPQSAALSGYVGVYATSFLIPVKRGEIPPRQWANGYVALPDAYLKYANLGLYSSIPSMYQANYLPSGFSPSGTPYTVDIATSNGAVVAQHVLVADVGPWNEDDNWWDPVKTDTTIPSGCPVSSTLHSSSSLANPAVDGICPGTSNWRRVYYYLLYKHYALPFFQPGAYSPSGSFAEGTNWPLALPQNCAEASAASVNNDNVACAAPYTGYNANNGAWLRGGSYDGPVLNQAGIDLGPAEDTALGWTWPSSGYVQVNTSRLP